MSVLTFGVAEYANVLTVIASNATNRHGQSMQALAETLSLISGANVACFNDKYRSKQPRIEAREIVAAVGEIRGKGDLAMAVRTVQLFEYNCVDNLDGFSVVEGSRHALCDILKRMMLVCALAARVVES